MLVRVSNDGLREVKKRATGHALATAAFELTLKRGLDAVSIEDIAHRAGVSRRTFANYYSCKEEAVTAVLALDISDHAELPTNLDIPSEEALLEAASAAVRREMTADRVRLFRTLDTLTIKHPQLRPYLLSVHDEARSRRTEQLLNCDASSQISPISLVMLLGALHGTLSIALAANSPVRLPGEHHTSPADIDLDAYLDLVFDRLRHGSNPIPRPHR